MTDPEELSGGDPSPVEGDGFDDRHHSRYSFNGQNPELSPHPLDDMFPHSNSSTLHSHGSYTYPYPPRHQSSSDYHPPSHRPSLQPPQFPHGPSNSVRSAPLYSPHEQPSLPPLPLSQNHVSGSGYQSSQSSHSGYWNDRASGNPHNGGSGYSSTSSPATTTPASSHSWSSMLPRIPDTFSSHGTRERSYTTTALPTVKSSFPSHGSSPGILQTQLPLPPLNSVGNGNSSGGGSGLPHRPWSSGPNSQSGNGGNYLPTLTSAFYPPSSAGNGPLNSPSSTNTSSGYFPSPPSTTSSTSTGTAGGGDRLLTPPELTYDLPRPAVGEIGVGGGYNHQWDRK